MKVSTPGDDASREIASARVACTWYRDAQAKDGHGSPVTHDDDAAMARDITRAVCRLYGWPRALDAVE
jgi:hypothetical protein